MKSNLKKKILIMKTNSKKNIISMKTNLESKEEYIGK